MLAVIAIMALLVSFSPNLWRSGNITTSGNLVMEDLAYARELAIANNQLSLLQVTPAFGFRRLARASNC